MIPSAEFFVIDQKICAAPRRLIDHCAITLAALSAIILLGKKPKEESQDDRAEEIDPSCHRQQRSY
jgi:hypothetical protein